MEKKRHLNIKYRIFNCIYTCSNSLRSFESELVKIVEYEMISIFQKDPVHLKYQFSFLPMYNVPLEIIL